MTRPRRTRRAPKEPPSPPPAPAPTPAAPAEGEEGPGNPERLYALTGLSDGGRMHLDLVTLVVARSAPPRSGTPEQAAVLRLCGNPLSVAELSAYLKLPFSAMTVLITELITAELVQVRAPIVRQTRPDRSILEAVMHGLQRL
ncbi:DUF742 domain-containing protein [Streptomyces sp. SID4985]|uniref:DUF742 domain-containing protein n=1 Tax=unclassified Streptomyces TaxID=2593676 RepID=UPI00136ADC41|nr:DUF742 domain-containing protein [Streptomyces sp. SID4985]MYQ44146.1 DUF742 domain-containing protein [Streptomyces sp. SID4985]